MLKWEALALIDRRFEIFSQGFGYLGKYTDFFSRYQINRQDFEPARQEYEARLGARMLELTDPAADRAKQDKPRRDFRDIYEYGQYLENARRSALTWEILETLLEGSQQEITALAQKIRNDREQMDLHV